MRNIQATNRAELYRISAGSDTQATIKPSDARNYRQGHASLTGEMNGEQVNIGYSSARDGGHTLADASEGAGGGRLGLLGVRDGWPSWHVPSDRSEGDRSRSRSLALDAGSAIMAG